MGFRKIMLIPSDYQERFGDKEWFIPSDCALGRGVCYADDGSPVAFGKETIIKVGKRRFLKVTNEEV